ncbi:MAG: 50S ribosomal protein L10 [Alphaproteobacteria bacterium]
MTRTEKEAEVKELNERFSNNELVVLTHFTGLTVAQVTKFRRELVANGASYKVTKNSLAKIALKGTKFEAISDKFVGPTGVATSKDPVAAAKVAHNFAKANDKLIILGGQLGDKILDANAVKALAQLPSLDELRAKLLGLFQAPAQKIAGVLQAPARDLVGVTKAYGEKK